MRVLFLMLLLPAYALADDCNVVDSCNYSSMWSGFSKFDVMYSDLKESKGSKFEYFVSGNESLMTFETKNGTAKIYSIPGVASLWKGIDTVGIKSDQECHEVVKDTQAIIQSYAVRALFFLGFGTKGGPDNFDKEINIDISSKEDTRVQINPGDYMMIGGPWTLKGHVIKNKNIVFDISHQFIGKNGKLTSLYLTGEWVNTPLVIPVENEESIRDWLVCLSGRSSYEDGKNIFTPIISDASKLHNIGDLKALTKQIQPTQKPRG